MNRLDLSDYGDRTIPLLLQRQARENGDSLFLLDQDKGISFAEAESLAARLAAGLRERGVGPGDRVALYLGNCSEFVLVTLAVNRLAAVWVPVNTDYRGEWLRDTLERSRCRLIVTDKERAGRLTEAEIAGPEVVALDDDGLAALTTAGSVTEPAPQHFGDTSAILWTSGTTGRSKGVMQSHNGWIRAIDLGASPLFDSRPGDVIYCALPLFNTGAWITSVYRALIEGLPCVIEARFSVSDFWQRVRRFEATQTFLIGAMGVFLWNVPESPDDATTPLRKAMIVPFPPDLCRPFERRFSLEILPAGLGMSECQFIANQLAASVELPPHSLGYPATDIELKLCDAEGVEVPDGEAGEMCIRPLAPHVLFNGYFEDPEASRTAFRGDWFLTGDVARRDPATGALFFVDRKKDVVRFAGRNISTLEVEGVVRRHPAVADVAAFGLPAAELASEDELKLNVVLKPGCTVSEETLCRFINDNAPHYFVPRYLEFVESLPYTPTNKVQKYRLRTAGVSDTTWDRNTSGFEVSR
jgi:crotonobetaine/carnitine-CoA ligase